MRGRSPEERTLGELSDDELLDLISELPDDDELARAIRELIDRRRRDE